MNLRKSQWMWTNQRESPLMVVSFCMCYHASMYVCVMLCLQLRLCVSQRCSKDRVWWSEGRKGRLMDIILMGKGSTTIQAIRTGKRASEDWWWWTWVTAITQTPELMNTEDTDHHLHWTRRWFFFLLFSTNIFPCLRGILETEDFMLFITLGDLLCKLLSCQIVVVNISHKLQKLQKHTLK